MFTKTGVSYVDAMSVGILFQLNDFSPIFEVASRDAVA
jgi:hypothetical protein